MTAFEASKRTIGVPGEYLGQEILRRQPGTVAVEHMPREGKRFDVRMLRRHRVEIKTDIKSASTGNLFIEVKSRGNPSGIVTTEADYWLILSFDPRERSMGGIAYVFPTWVLRRTIHDYADEMDLVDGGDDGTSKGRLMKKYRIQAYIEPYPGCDLIEIRPSDIDYFNSLVF